MQSDCVRTGTEGAPKRALFHALGMTEEELNRPLVGLSLIHIFPGIRSTFGTGTELLNSLRLMFSRLANHRCPKGHDQSPTLAVAAGQELVCSECGVHFYAPSAEELAFNSQGACRTCGGTGLSLIHI